MNSKNNRSVRRTRTALARSFVELAAAKPVRSITVNELADRADVSRSTFYTHFHDVFELRESIGAELIAESERRFQEVMADRTPRPDNPEDSPMLEAICAYIFENAAAFRVLLGDNGDPAFRHDLEAVIRADVIESMADLYGAMPPEHVEDFATFMSAGGIGLTRAWLDEDPPADPHVMARRIGLIMKGAAMSLTQRS